MCEVMRWDVNEILQSSRVSVIILNQPILCATEILLPLWNRASIRLAVDGGSNRWRTLEQSLFPATLAPPHYVMGDLDSITPDTEAYLRDKGVAFISTPNQEYTDFTKALLELSDLILEKQLSVDYVVCVCEHAGRLDQTIANLETLHLIQGWGGNLKPILLAQNTLTWLLPPGNHSIVVPEVCVNASLPCGLIPLCGSTAVTTRGLKWDLDDGVLSFGKLVSTSNTFERTNIEVKTRENLVWTIQFLQEHS